LGDRQSSNPITRLPDYPITQFTYRLCCFGHFSSAQASRADANPPDATVDHRLDELKVRLESPRAHVVGVAVLPADHWTLPAHLTSLSHSRTLKLSAFSYQLSAQNAP
jgi:hypothetical protein